ncbi:alpha/beta fold hydrolase [Paracoccus rhizosphaerae]|uniref:Alpha/beta fold hydrolase n=1 Tax=Paracoccus rhizosphaerae TaxID=1133347 RepID=A0ABV6CET8_9RHOB|nr:alpha/beta hydrolase [Paracoccus rhizosphaerae]
MTMSQTMTTRHTSASAAGILSARIIRPASRSGLAPLVVLHGISRNAAELAALFAPEAERSGRTVVVPHFRRSLWPLFQRPCRAARPDLALLALLSELRGLDPDLAGRVDLFGHSGRAQLAHRFAMLYPQRVGRLNLAAAGWYCLPDGSMPFPYGLGAAEAPKDAVWQRRHAAPLDRYLSLDVSVFVGTKDVDRDDTLRQTPLLDDIQGPTRLVRAERFVASFTAAAHARRIRPRIDLIHLPDVSHDVVEAIVTAGLAQRVTRAA